MPKSTQGKDASQLSISLPATKIIFVLGDKGGVGKSMVSQAVADYLHGRGVQLAILEADTRNPDVGRMFEGEVPVAQANVRSDNGWMDVMDFVTSHVGHTIVINTPAGIGDYMANDLASFGKFFVDQGIPVELEMWWVMNIQHDSVNLLHEAYRSYGQHFKRIRVVCNLHFANGDSSEHGPFFLWHESPLRTEIEKRGGRTIYFPGLHLRVVKKLFDPEIIMPFSQASDAAIGEAVRLEVSERWKLQQWLSQCDAAFEPLFNNQ